MDFDATRRNKKARPLNDAEKEGLDEFVDAIHYSARYAFFLPLHYLSQQRRSLLPTQRSPKPKVKTLLS